MCELKVKDQIRKVLEREPMLTDSGLGADRAREPQKGHDALLTDTKEFEKICKLLRRVRETRTINSKANSYRLKHAAERTIGSYISNGIFIAAAINCGFDYKKQYDEFGNLGPNVLFYMSEKSIKDVFLSTEQHHSVREHWVVRGK